MTRFIWLIPLVALLGSPWVSRAQTNNQAGLVVEFGDGSLFTGCIAFEGESISGYDLLARSGLSLETAFDPSQGIAVCKIEADGCPSDDCFCQMPEYWSYWNWAGGSWSYAGSGSSTNHVGDGDVDGWSWGTGSPPPSISFNELCAPPPPPPPTQTSPPAPTATNTPEPQPSDTPQPEPTETFIPPTYTVPPTETIVPESPTPGISARRTSTATPGISRTPQATQAAEEDLPKSSPTEPSRKGSLNAPAATLMRASADRSSHEARQESKNENDALVGYAVFGALLVGLGLTLTRIILKGQKR